MHKFNFFLTRAEILSKNLLNNKLKRLILSNYIHDLIYIFYPDQCVSCGCFLIEKASILCYACGSDLPRNYMSGFADNRVEKLFFGRLKIQEATSLLIFHKRSITQKLLHHLKYKGRQDIGAYLGRLLAYEMLFSDRFTDLDCILPVPLHPQRQRSRGYNQVATFGQQLSNRLCVPYVEHYLKRKGNRISQTVRNRFERNLNMVDTFYLYESGFLKNKHVLLVDDIITTGATLEACARLILEIEGTRVSLASMAFTE